MRAQCDDGGQKQRSPGECAEGESVGGKVLGEDVGGFLYGIVFMLTTLGRLAGFEVVDHTPETIQFAALRRPRDEAAEHGRAADDSGFRSASRRLPRLLIRLSRQYLGRLEHCGDSGKSVCF